MRVPVFQSDHGPCPYLENRNWVTYSFSSTAMEPELYEALLEQGWRRSGTTYYQNHCPGCRLCIPIRVPVERFAPSKSQRRVQRRNADVTVETGPTGWDSEVFELYVRYLTSRHAPTVPPGEEEYMSFLGSSPGNTILMKYRSAGRLIGAGWVDRLPGGLSSVYFAFEPDEARRSLGTLSIMREIDLARQERRNWLYLGFYVPDSRKMEYKASFRPHQIAVNGRWLDAD
ncbi:arginyltransferase [Salinispira pacifica]